MAVNKNEIRGKVNGINLSISQLESEIDEAIEAIVYHFQSSEIEDHVDDDKLNDFAHDFLTGYVERNIEKQKMALDNMIAENEHAWDQYHVHETDPLA